MESSCACLDFLRLSLTTNWDRHEAFGCYAIKRTSSLNERRNIRESARNCRLCQKIYECLKDPYGSEFDLEDEENRRFIKMRMGYSSFYGEENLVSTIRLSCDTEPRQDFRSPNIDFSAWADEGTPASKDFVTWSPIVHGIPEETIRFAGKLLHNCLDHHEACSGREPVGEFDLPSRVLSIQNSAESISVKLVENKGLSGRYCALSHCWGPEGKRPLRTTRENITDHLASISWNNLPPLFQDAITLTWGLGIEYLWIDSLCIVQDDKQDWLNESMNMASIYRGATLVIAAVDSEDSTQRLSKAKRPEPLMLRIPYYTQEGSPQGGYNIAESARLWDPVNGPLKERGWAFQEFYLGRRKIFFTSKGLNWKCGECELTERGNYCDLEFHETMKWLICLSIYSEKHLTYPSDRITALLGIVAEIGESRNDSFVPKCGVWEDELAEQLLWMPLEIRDEDLPDLPSWSWAATGGAKLWMEHEALQEVVINGVVQTVKLKESGSVGASGLLIRAKIAPVPIRECCIRYFQSLSIYRVEMYMLPEISPERYDMRGFPILNHDETLNPLGLARFDGWIDCSKCFFFILASSSRGSNDPRYSITSIFELDNGFAADLTPKSL